MKNINNKNRIKDLWNFLTVPSGRLRRRDFIVTGFCLSILFVLFTIIWTASLSNPLFPILIILFLLIAIIFVWIALVALIKRLQDIGISQFWGILILIPYFGFIPGLFFLLKDGTIGPNKYGLDPKGRKMKKN